MYIDKLQDFMSISGCVADEFKKVRHCYAFTVVPNKHDRVYDEYDIRYTITVILNYFKAFSISKHSTFELKKDNTLHWHGIMQTPKVIYKKAFNRFIEKSLPGWSINVKKLDKIKDYRVWKNYLFKTRKYSSQDQILTEHKCLQYNLFQ